MDYDKTAQLYEKYGLKKTWDQLPDTNRHNKEKAFFDQVRSKRTGEHCQAEDLIKRELVPESWQPPDLDKKGKPLKYPLEHVNEIIRKRLITGEEYLLSRKTITGLDSAGNAITLSWNDKEFFDNILPIYKNKPYSRDSPLISVIDHIDHRKEYTLPYTPENVQELYDKRNGRCALVLHDESKGDSPPVSVDSFPAFKSKTFDELWDLVSTPRYRMDRSYRDNLDDSHIG